MTIVGILASIAMFRAGDSLERARESRAMGDLSTLARDLLSLDSLPTSLAGISRGGMLDPWGNPYQYVKVIVDPHTGAITNVGQLRKDRFLVPISAMFDLYSMGPDGRTATSLTSALGADDIVAANDGGFIGPASTY